MWIVRRWPLAVVIGLAFIASCGRVRQGQFGEPLEPFDADVMEVVVEVDAAPGAAPLFDPLPSGVSPWRVTRTNLARLFGPGVEVRVPMSLAQVGSLSTDAAMFSSSALLDLSTAHAEAPKEGQVRFHVMFLAGVFVDDDGVAQPGVAAANVAGTRVLAVFSGRPGQGDATPSFAAAAQQAAVVHEIGHALGLVGLDTPMVNAHAKRGDPGHCAVPDCVMADRGAPASQVQSLLSAGADRPSLGLFGPECLRDIDARRQQKRANR